MATKDLSRKANQWLNFRLPSLHPTTPVMVNSVVIARF
jgi:hypothetical protein